MPETFPVASDDVYIPPTKPTFLLDQDTRVAMSVEPVYIGEQEPPNFDKIITPPSDAHIPLVKDITRTPSTSKAARPPVVQQAARILTLTSESAQTIFADVIKLSKKSYTPAELFAKYPNTITGTQPEFIMRSKNKTFVTIAVLTPKNAADVKIIMDGENIHSDSIAYRLKNSR